MQMSGLHMRACTTPCMEGSSDRRDALGSPENNGARGRVSQAATRARRSRGTAWATALVSFMGS